MVITAARNKRPLEVLTSVVSATQTLLGAPLPANLRRHHRTIIRFTPPREPTNPAEALLRHACFARALAECRPGKLVEIDWGGKGRTTKTVVPLKNRSCAMRIESNGPRRIVKRGLDPTFSAIPAVKVCAFVKLDVSTNRLDCLDEVIESEVDEVFHPIVRSECRSEIAGDKRPSQREKACLVNALLDCTNMRASYRVPIDVSDEKTGFSGMRLLIRHLGPADTIEKMCSVTLLDYAQASGSGCTNAREVGMGLSAGWSEHSLFLVPIERCHDLDHQDVKHIEETWQWFTKAR